MEFTFFNPVKIHFGECCIEKNKGLIQNLFKKNQGKAMLVTGKHSAKKSGALGDITGVLESSNIPYVIYDEVSSNPTMACVTEASKIAREAGVTFVIGIGGGVTD